MPAQTRLSFSDFQQWPLEETLKGVVTNRQVLIVRFPDGTEVVIRPKLPLKPLPVLKGFVPSGWKNALYGESE
ncbi:MAG: hypothetical protein GY862_13495 [Gammaproteobacteria bacterium]|nr:hypothetical protein [Gammaproteobacteria bacterium]